MALTSKDYDPNTCLCCGDPMIVYDGKSAPLCSKCEANMRNKWNSIKLGDRSAKQMKKVFTPVNP